MNDYPTARRNKYAGLCRHCYTVVPSMQGDLRQIEGRWLVEHKPQECQEATPATPVEIDLSHLQTGTYTLQGEILRIEQGGGRWSGFVFVKDSEGERLGKQRHGYAYVGEQASLLADLLKDPLGALQEYGRLSGVCGMCHLTLTDELSVAAGIGPVCAKKWGIDRTGLKVLAGLSSEVSAISDAPLDDAALHALAWAEMQDEWVRAFFSTPVQAAVRV